MYESSLEAIDADAGLDFHTLANLMFSNLMRLETSSCFYGISFGSMNRPVRPLLMPARYSKLFGLLSAHVKKRLRWASKEVVLHDCSLAA